MKGMKDMKAMKWVGAVGVIVMGVAAGSCSQNTTPTPTPQTATLVSQASIDGMVSSNGAFQANKGAPFTGDQDAIAPGIGTRQIFSFDISTLPAGITISSATLQLYQATVTGQPYTVLGNVTVDHVDIGSSLQASDYNGGTLSTAIGNISTSPAIGYQTLNVLAAVTNDVASGRKMSQYRVRFTLRDSNNDGANDNVQFTDAEVSCCNLTQTPQLVIVYTQ